MLNNFEFAFIRIIQVFAKNVNVIICNFAIFFVQFLLYFQLNEKLEMLLYILESFKSKFGKIGVNFLAQSWPWEISELQIKEIADDSSVIISSACIIVTHTKLPWQ